MNNNFLARIFEWIGEAFEKMNPAVFRLLAAVLPYLSPFPIAWLSASAASTFLGFTTEIAFVFVLVLEGIGLWFTSMLVDSVVDYTRSKNRKSLILVAVLGLAVLIYIVILILLNVIMKMNHPDYTVQYGVVVGLVSLLPLITGVGNGYYKFQLKTSTIMDEQKEYQRNLDERIRQEKADERLRKAALKQGINIFAVQAPQVDTVSPDLRHGDWRKLTKKEKQAVKGMETSKVAEMYGVSESTARRWKQWSRDIQ